MRSWLVVASADHAALGVQGGFVMANHGRRAPLAQMRVGDQVLIYSPKRVYGEVTPLKAFTALGVVAGEEPYEHGEIHGKAAFRRTVVFRPVREVPLDEVRDYVPLSKLRFGFFGLDERQGETIAERMLAGK